jgi:hypothetical protein
VDWGGVARPKGIYKTCLILEGWRLVGTAVLVGALILGFGQKELMAITAAAGGLIAFYQIGYGIAAFGVGPLQTWAGLDLNII